jgi:tetratricopeptide (TPR) repeat protein
MHYPDETHISEPVKAFYDGIRHIFSGWYLNYNSSAFRKSMTGKMLIDHYELLSEQYGYKVIPPQDEINLVAKMFRRDPKKMNDAIELMEMNTKNYPSSAGAFELLADIYQQSGDKERSLTNYQKALSLDKENDTIQKKIEKLKNL